MLRLWLVANLGSLLMSTVGVCDSSASVVYDHIFKLILIGDNAVGKSSFVRRWVGVFVLMECFQCPLYRFCENNFVSEMETTIGVDFYLSDINLNGKKIKVLINNALG